MGCMASVHEEEPSKQQQQSQFRKKESKNVGDSKVRSGARTRHLAQHANGGPRRGEPSREDHQERRRGRDDDVKSSSSEEEEEFRGRQRVPDRRLPSPPSLSEDWAKDEAAARDAAFAAMGIAGDARSPMPMPSASASASEQTSDAEDGWEGPPRPSSSPPPNANFGPWDFPEAEGAAAEPMRHGVVAALQGRPVPISPAPPFPAPPLSPPPAVTSPKATRTFQHVKYAMWRLPNGYEAENKERWGSPTVTMPGMYGFGPVPGRVAPLGPTEHDAPPMGPPGHAGPSGGFIVGDARPDASGIPLWSGDGE